MDAQITSDVHYGRGRHHHHHHHQNSVYYAADFGYGNSSSNDSGVAHHGGQFSDKKKKKLHYMMSKIIMWQRVVAGLMLAVAILGVIAIISRSPKALFLRPVTADFNLGAPQTLLLASVPWILVIAAVISMITRAYFGFSEAGKKYAYTILDHKNSGYSHHMARHINRERWILLGAFVTCIIEGIALLVGVTDIFILIGIAIANVTLHWSAYVLERKNHRAPDEKSVTLLPMIFGFLLWAFIQGSILAYFVLGLLSGALGVQPPYWPYYTAVIGVALVQTRVGLLAFLRYTRASRCYTRNIYIERCYLLAEVAYAVFAIVPLVIAAFL